MTNPQDLKTKLGETTQQIENKAGELWTNYSPHYTNLEPWQRGTLLIALTLFLIFVIYYLTKPDKNLIAKKEAQLEEKILRQMAFYKRLRE